jgi:hypothetical protein
MDRKLLVRGFKMAAVVAVVALAATPQARAGQLFGFDYSLPGMGATPMDVSASGFFATTDPAGGSSTITGVWGSWNGMATTGVLAPGSYGSNDYLLFSSGPPLDFNGLGFMVNGPGDDGAGNVNVYYDAAQGGYTENSPNVGGGPAFSISPAIPSPVYFTFNYSIAGAGSTPMDVWASGLLTTFNTDASSYQVNDISGTWNGAAILSLLTPGTFGGNDNVLFGAGPHLTSNGLSFAVNGVGDDGLGNVNVFYVGGYNYTEYSNNVTSRRHSTLRRFLSQLLSRCCARVFPSFFSWPCVVRDLTLSVELC